MMNGLFLAACRSLANQTHHGIYAAQALRYKGACIRSVAKAIEEEGDSVSDSTVAKVLFLASDEVGWMLRRLGTSCLTICEYSSTLEI